MSVSKVGLTSFGLLVVPLLVGCPPGNKKVGRFDCSDLATTYFTQPQIAQQTEFVRLDLEKQYAVLICGNQVIHPPAMYLARSFAGEGERAAAFLRTKLSEAPDDATVRDIVLVFAEMHRQRTYEVARDTGLMRSISERVNQMSNPEWRRITTEMVSEIQR